MVLMPSSLEALMAIDMLTAMSVQSDLELLEAEDAPTAGPLATLAAPMT